MGKAKGTKSPTPGPMQQEEGLCSGRAGHQPGSQRQGGRDYQLQLGAGKTHAVLGRKKPKKKLAAWSPTRMEWGAGGRQLRRF